MKIVVAPDSFKGSLSAAEVAHSIAEKAKEHFPNAKVVSIPIADGGEGTLEALLSGKDFEKIECTVTGPDFRPSPSYYLRDGEAAYIEMALTSGLGMVQEPSARKTTSQGLGEAIAHALDAGAKMLYIAIGGSATNDGGIGMMRALGVRFLDENGEALCGIGDNLSKICAIDLSGMHPRIREIKCKIICDVKNPLVGKTGATMMYGAQKGASQEELIQLEAGMQNYAAVLEKTIPGTWSSAIGGGAAGGVGAALMAFLGGQFCSGIETVLDILDFNKTISDADLIITGEGKMDAQSAFGKAAVGVAARCGDKPCIALVGGIGEGFEAVYQAGIRAVYSVFHTAMPLTEAMKNAELMLKNAADRMFRLLKIQVNNK
ncbi:MAG: glycerate kinase [Clostridia bacterium]|nr:glycerate kinase [Clostridia bacterium]